jgi:hypothetical protein
VISDGLCGNFDDVSDRKPNIARIEYGNRAITPAATLGHSLCPLRAPAPRWKPGPTNFVCELDCLTLDLAFTRIRSLATKQLYGASLGAWGNRPPFAFNKLTNPILRWLEPPYVGGDHLRVESIPQYIVALVFCPARHGAINLL